MELSESTATSASRSNSKLKNILMICIDSLRPEALSCHPEAFRKRETFPWRVHTPTADQLAREGTLFTNCIVQAPFTPTSHASYFTGLNPPNHGIRAFFGYKLLDQAETMAERLKGEGYRTAAVIGADALNERYGLNRGFDIYDTAFDQRMCDWIRGYYRRDGSEATDRTLDWLQSRQEPFFLFVHYFDVHLIAPHVLAERDRVAHLLWKISKSRLARGPMRRILQAPERFYGNYRRCGKPYHVRQVRTTDREIDRIVQKLKGLELYDETIIIIMSDHGDAFGEHDETGHRKSLYDTTLRVPLILKASPSHADTIIGEQVRSIDLVPTLYELLELQPKASTGYRDIDGRSMVPLIERKKSEQYAAYSETRMEKSLDRTSDLRSHYVSLRTPHWKLIINMLDGSRELYDLSRDSGETHNLITQQPNVAEALFQEAMDIYGAVEGETQSQVVYSTKEMEKVEIRLRDLGYL